MSKKKPTETCQIEKGLKDYIAKSGLILELEALNVFYKEYAKQTESSNMLEYRLGNRYLEREKESGIEKEIDIYSRIEKKINLGSESPADEFRFIIECKGGDSKRSKLIVKDNPLNTTQRISLRTVKNGSVKDGCWFELDTKKLVENPQFINWNNSSNGRFRENSGLFYKAVEQINSFIIHEKKNHKEDRKYAYIPIVVTNTEIITLTPNLTINSMQVESYTICRKVPYVIARNVLGAPPSPYVQNIYIADKKGLSALVSFFLGDLSEKKLPKNSVGESESVNLSLN